MSIKTALVQGPITPDLRTRLESMGFEIVDMNDSEAMKDLRRTLETQLVIRKVHDACGMPMVGLHHALRHVESSFPMEHVSVPMLLRAMDIEPIPDIRIDKTKDRFSFADKFVGRGRGSARNQNFSQHFKK